MKSNETKYKYIHFDSCPFCKSGKQSIRTKGQRLDKHQGLFPFRKNGLKSTIQNCLNCGLIFSNPMPVPLFLEDHYNVDPSVYWQNDYLDQTVQSYQSFITSFHELQKIEFPSKLAVDLGSGLGFMVKCLLNNGFDAYGVEVSDQFKKHSIELNRFEEKRIIRQSVEEVSFDEESIDFVNFGAILEHLENPVLILEKTLTWLKPGGLIFLEVPSSDWLMSRFLNFFYTLTFQKYVTNLSPLHPPYHLFEFSEKTFHHFCRIHKCELVKHEVLVCDTFVNKKFDFFLKPIMEKTKTGMQHTFWIRKKS